ncbi:unnamed protein product [Ectocarpus sp. CCAP 1310/34]|nr:unnamed protein product [Ectocarpus sp. CCAP 1310/34]
MTCRKACNECPLVKPNGGISTDLTWEFFQANFERIKGMLAKASPSLMDAVILYCCGGFTEEDRMEEVKAFFEANPVPNSARKLSQMLESMAINVRFFKTIAASPLATEAFWEGLEV